MPTSRPPAAVVLRRGLAARCPACGRGHVFRSGVATERACAGCGWRFERCPGHWVGGNEVNVLATFPVGIAAYAVAALAFGAGPAAVAAATGAAVAFSLAFYRSSRGVYFALDYLLDPVADDATPPRDDRRGGDGGAGGPDDGRGGDAGPRRAARPATAAAETFIPVSTAPGPPATTVSR